jgi:hypothetical protein
VYSNGALGGFVVNENKDMALTNFIKKQLLSLPKPWFPALGRTEDFLILVGDSAEMSSLKVKVNSTISFSLF